MGLLFVLSGVLSVVRSLARNVARNIARISSFFAILSVSKLSAFFCGVTFCVVRSAVSSQESCEECCEECRDECSEECCECRYILGIFFWHYFFVLQASKL